jgi:hypothetical protein
VNLLRLTGACCTVILAAACAAGPYSDAAPDPQRLGGSQTTTSGSARGGETSARPGGRRTLAGGLAVTVSAPKVFTPTETASPHAPRAVAFELTIDNEGSDVYLPAQLAVTAMSNGVAALQVIDSTQGYTGTVSADALPPGEHLRVAVAFAIPKERAEVALRLQPNAEDGGGVVLFQGTV